MSPLEKIHRLGNVKDFINITKEEAFMEDFLTMSNKELEKSKIMDRLIQGSLHQKQAAEVYSAF